MKGIMTMSRLFDIYLEGCIWCLPFVLYWMGVYNNSIDGKLASWKTRLLALVVYTTFCLGSWVMFVLNVLVFIVDILQGHLTNIRNKNENGNSEN